MCDISLSSSQTIVPCTPLYSSGLMHCVFVVTETRCINNSLLIPSAYIHCRIEDKYRSELLLAVRPHVVRATPECVSFANRRLVIGRTDVIDK